MKLILFIIFLGYCLQRIYYGLDFGLNQPVTFLFSKNVSNEKGSARNCCTSLGLTVLFLTRDDTVPETKC